MSDLKIVGLNLFLSIFLMALLVMFFGGFLEDKPVELRDVKFNYLQLDLKVGEKDKLTVTPVPGDAKIKKIVWESESENIVTVDQNGNVKGIKEGTTIINAIADSVTQSIKVYVK